jgi:hypothetical protein
MARSVLHPVGIVTFRRDTCDKCKNASPVSYPR